MPTLDTAVVYPGGCLLEGTNLSEGRGTTCPFELFGAPWLDGGKLAAALGEVGLPGFVARPVTFMPTFHKHAKQICGGLFLHVTDRDVFRPVATYIAIIALSAYQAPDAFRFRTEKYEFVDDIPAIDLLAGRAALREGIEQGKPPREIIEAICPVGDPEREIHQAAVERVAAAEARR
jgi:uncharacterized protein YbbC (DUF1343 family)